LAETKKEVSGSYVVSLSNTRGLARNILKALEDDRPLSWVDEFPKRIEAITIEDAHEAAEFLAALPLSVATAGSV
jgi:zinc protease